jgi:hypothetical protein
MGLVSGAAQCPSTDHHHQDAPTDTAWSGNSCGEKPTLALTMLNPKSGRTVRMFKCKCGEQSWAEDKD